MSDHVDLKQFKIVRQENFALGPDDSNFEIKIEKLLQEGWEIAGVSTTEHWNMGGLSTAIVYLRR